jgi:hypothetical protein
LESPVAALLAVGSIYKNRFIISYLEIIIKVQ